MKKPTFIITVVSIGILVTTVFYYRGDFSSQQAITSGASVGGDSENITKRIVEKSDGALQILFYVAKDNLRFNDALNMTREEFESLSDEDIEVIMWRRFQNWRIFTNQ